MRIGELADLAGVTVRTVHHYHRLGVLPEPPRRANGYRRYAVDDLVTLLRIRELTRTGLSLVQAGDMVLASGGGACDAEDALDEVDRELRMRIAELVERRRRLARARSHGHVGLSRLAAALRAASADAPAAVLVAHLLGDGPDAERLADALLVPRLRDALLSAQRRFDAIDATTTDDVLDDLETDVRTTLEQLGTLEMQADHRGLALVLALAERDLNDRQREFLRRHR